MRGVAYPIQMYFMVSHKCFYEKLNLMVGSNYGPNFGTFSYDLIIFFSFLIGGGGGAYPIWPIMDEFTYVIS